MFATGGMISDENYFSEQYAGFLFKEWAKNRVANQKLIAVQSILMFAQV